MNCASPIINHLIIYDKMFGLKWGLKKDAFYYERVFKTFSPEIISNNSVKPFLYKKIKQNYG